MLNNSSVRSAGLFLAALLCGAGSLQAEPIAATDGAQTPSASPLGSTALDEQALTEQRGGTLVVNDMELEGVVSNNHASDLLTGNNTITDGAFAGTSGMPTVIQNSGNNVLIQNATIVNVQVQ